MAIAKLYRWNLNNCVGNGKWDFEKDYETDEQNAKDKLALLPNVDAEHYYYKFVIIGDNETTLGECFTCNCFLFI